MRLICPTCRATLHVREELAGRSVTCPDCRETLRVPSTQDPQGQLEEAARASAAGAIDIPPVGAARRPLVVHDPATAQIRTWLAVLLVLSVTGAILAAAWFWM
jgi:uncharacterized protein YbaR (Trm112 family)